MERTKITKEFVIDLIEENKQLKVENNFLKNKIVYLETNFKRYVRETNSYIGFLMNISEEQNGDTSVNDSISAK